MVGQAVPFRQSRMLAPGGAEARAWRCPCMCNDYERYLPADKLEQALSTAGLEAAAAIGNAVCADPIEVRVGDKAPVIHSFGNSVAVSSMRWGFAPGRKGAAPVFNFRAEGRRFRSSKRCVVPASAFFEFTGTRSPKSKWRFHLSEVPVFGVAGLWHEETDGGAFTMLTVPPGADVQPFHDRQIAVLPPSLWALWIYLDREEAELLAPMPAGTLKVELTRRGVQPPPTDLLERASFGEDA